MTPQPEQRTSPRAVDRLLNKWTVEERTSLDITTIYRKMKAGTFPYPVRVGRRRVAWRESDIAAWQTALPFGVGRRVDRRPEDRLVRSRGRSGGSASERG